MALESISIATCINTIFSNLSGDQRDTIRGKLEEEFIFFQEDLKKYTVDDLHDKVKVPLNAAKTLESFGLLKDPAAPTGTKSNFVAVGWEDHIMDSVLRVTMKAFSNDLWAAATLWSTLGFRQVCLVSVVCDLLL